MPKMTSDALYFAVLELLREELFYLGIHWYLPYLQWNPSTVFCLRIICFYPFELLRCIILNTCNNNSSVNVILTYLFQKWARRLNRKPTKCRTISFINLWKIWAEQFNPKGNLFLQKKITQGVLIPINRCEFRAIQVAYTNYGGLVL